MLHSPGGDPGVGRIARPKKEINPTFVGLISFWNPATSYSPGRFPSRSLPPGNSHSRALRSLPAIPDAPPRCFAHWARSASVPLAARDGKPNQVRCCTRLKMAREENSRRAKKKPSHKAELFLWNPATSYSPGRFQPCCFAHRARTAGNLAKYNACTCPQTARKQYSVRFQNKKHPIFMGCFLFWNPATSYSPGPSPAKYHRR